MSKWIKGAPAEAGWYWFRHVNDLSERPVPYYFNGHQVKLNGTKLSLNVPSVWEHHIDKIQWPE
jgi:hypothetical protein